MQDYIIQTKKGQGKYIEVYRAIQKKTNKKVALKIMKFKYQSLNKIKKDKQIKALKTLSLPNIINLFDVLYNQKQQKWLQFFNLWIVIFMNIINKRKILLQLIKSERLDMIFYKLQISCIQILYFIGTSNLKIFQFLEIILINQQIQGHVKVTINIIQIQIYHGHILNIFLQFLKKISHLDKTRWYGAPECLMTNGYYSQKMDVWSIGCVLFQLYTQFPLFPGKNQVDQISTNFSILGTPSEKTLFKFAKKTNNIKFDFQQVQGIGIQTFLTNAPAQFIDLIKKMLVINPSERITAKESLQHSFFYSLTELKKHRKNLISKISNNKEFMLPILNSHRKYIN